MTISAPSSSGFCKTGVQKQLSTASNAPAFLATPASAGISEISVSGLDGVSRKKRRVLGFTALCHAETSVADTNVDLRPKRLRILLNNCTVAPNTLCDTIT